MEARSNTWAEEDEISQNNDSKWLLPISQIGQYWYINSKEQEKGRATDAIISRFDIL